MNCTEIFIKEFYCDCNILCPESSHHIANINNFIIIKNELKRYNINT